MALALKQVENGFGARPATVQGAASPHGSGATASFGASFRASIPTSTRSPSECEDLLAQARIAHVPRVVLCFLLSILVPSELHILVGGLTFDAPRLVLFVALPMALMRLAGSRGIRLRAFDGLLVAAFVGYWLAMLAKYNVEKALSFGGTEVLLSLGGYFVARAYVRTRQTFAAVIRLLIGMTLAAGAVAACDAVLHVPLVKTAISSLTGQPVSAETAVRLGLMRASGFFDHPIHYGTFAASALCLSWYLSTGMRRLMRAGILGLAAIFSVSSAPLAAIGICFGGSVWERLTRGIPHRTAVSLTIVATAYALVSMLASRSVGEIIGTAIALDPSTAYYRLLIWEFGVRSLQASPLIGVTIEDWIRPAWMTTSIDHYWLLTAMRAGLPAAALYVGAIVLVLRSVLRNATTDPLRRCAYSWTTTVLAMCFVGSTVHYWGGMAAYFTFVLGMGAWMAEPLGLSADDSARPRAPSSASLTSRASPAPSDRAAA